MELIPRRMRIGIDKDEGQDDDNESETDEDVHDRFHGHNRNDRHLIPQSVYPVRNRKTVIVLHL